jgi:hypothetical protein
MGPTPRKPRIELEGLRGEQGSPAPLLKFSLTECLFSDIAGNAAYSS